jgi:hypothetical protein
VETLGRLIDVSYLTGPVCDDHSLSELIQNGGEKLGSDMIGSVHQAPLEDCGSWWNATRQ